MASGRSRRVSAEPRVCGGDNVRFAFSLRRASGSLDSFVAIPKPVLHSFPEAFGTSMSRGGAEHAEKIVRNEHCNWPSAVTAAPRDQVFQLSNFFRASLGAGVKVTTASRGV